MLGVIGLFPSYSGTSLASQAANLWPHVIFLAGWAAGAVLIFRGGNLQRTGALIATGLSVVTFGLFLADAGFPIADGSSLLGAGLVLSLIGWAACAAGSVIAFGRWPADWPRRPLGPDAGVIAALIVAAIGVAATFAPAWDKISLPTGTGVSLSETLGNAFSNPGAVIVGDVAVMLGLVAVVVVAVLWRPARLGWALIAGAMIPMAAQIVSALAQLGQTTTAGDLLGPNGAAQLGISTSQVAPHQPDRRVLAVLRVRARAADRLRLAGVRRGGERSCQPVRLRPPGRRRLTPQSPGQGSWPGAPASYAAPAAYPARRGYSGASGLTRRHRAYPAPAQAVQARPRPLRPGPLHSRPSPGSARLAALTPAGRPETDGGATRTGPVCPRRLPRQAGRGG